VKPSPTIRIELFSDSSVSAGAITKSIYAAAGRRRPSRLLSPQLEAVKGFGNW
jgi:hypothetical protein